MKSIRRASKKDLEDLIQGDLVRLTIFLEYRFKGYKRLRRRYRRKLYTHANGIARDFLRFYEESKRALLSEQRKLNFPSVLKADERVTYLLGIMKYLEPGKRLEYQAGASFEKLLRDPASMKLSGDCNQITTLYIYLYSLSFPVTDLKLKILPNHICLHYKGIDIETTSAAFVRYDDYTYLSDVQEIVSANLLDISDPTESQFEISPENLLQSAELAFYFSSHRITVEKNLFIAYYNMAVYHAKRGNYSKAVLFANKSGNTKLQKEITRLKAVGHLKMKRYEKARDKFRKIGDSEGERVCYQNELVDLLDSIKSCKSVSDYMKHRTVLRRMKELGLRVENQKVVDFVNEISKKFV